MLVDPEAADHETGLLGCRLARERRGGLDRTGPEGRHGRDDLEDRARDVAALRRPREEWLRGVVADCGEARFLGCRIGDRRCVVERRRREDEHLACPRVQHDHRTAVVSEPADRGPLELERQGQGQCLRVVRVRLELLQDVPDRVRIAQAGQFRPEGTLEARRAVALARVADDRGDGPIGVDAVEAAVRIPFVRGEDGPVPIDDLAPDDAAGRDRDRGIVRSGRQVLGTDHLPVAGARREDAEGERQRDPDVGDAPGDRPACHQPEPLRVRRARRPRGPGAGGGSTPLSDRARRRPTTIPLTTSDEPP